MHKLAEKREERKEAARKAAQEKKKAKKQAEAMEAQAALKDGKPPQTRPQNKEAKKQAEAMAKQKEGTGGFEGLRNPTEAPTETRGLSREKSQGARTTSPPRRASSPKALPCPSSFSEAGVQQVPLERQRLP